MRQPVTVLLYDRSRRKPPDKSGAFESLIKTLSGIAGTITLFSALLSIFGFLLLRSHSNLLGLSNFLDHSVSDYFYAGAAFASYTFYSVVEVLLRDIRVVLAAVGVFFAAKALARWPRRPKPRIAKAASWAVPVSKALMWALLILAALLVVYFMYKSLPPTQAGGLLFESGDNAERLKRADVNLGGMEASYLNAVRYFILSCLALWTAYFAPRLADLGDPARGTKKDADAASNRPTPARAGAGHASVIVRAALTLLVISQLFLLPVIYGQTVYSK